MIVSEALRQRAKLLGANLGEFARFAARRSLSDRIPQTAAELSYISILSLAPLYAIVFPLLRAFPPFRGALTALQDFIYENFVPAGGPVIREALAEVAARASKLTPSAIAILVVTLLVAMATIDGKINAIWRVRRKRRLLSRVLVYWAVLSLGPLLVGIGLAVTSYLASLPLMARETSYGAPGTLLLGALPFLASALAFALIYLVVPNRRVPLWSAVSGALAAAFVFELAKRGFAAYLQHFASYESLYGALAALPVFLIWIFLSWVVTLSGAELSYCLATWYPGVERSEEDETTLLRAMRIMRRLGLHQSDGTALSPERWNRKERSAPWETVREIVDCLERAQLVHTTEKEEVALARPLAKITVHDLLQALGPPLPRDGEALSSPAIDALLADARGALGRSLDRDLESVLLGTEESRDDETGPLDPLLARARQD